jgi:hypothetical protein
MAGFFQDTLQDAAGAFFGSEYLRDYTHASKTFRPNSYAYAPKLKFLFHVYFDINPAAYGIGLSQGANFGLAVKSVKLPAFNFDTHQMNQYNRKRIVQTKLKYDPIDINFHDDNNNLIRNMWYNYYTYYYKDSSKPVVSISGRQTNQNSSNTNVLPNNSSYNNRNIYSQSIPGDTDWGYIGETANTVNGYTEAANGQTKIPFFKNITVFGFHQHNYVAYTLINPIITKFSHDTYNYAEGNGTMENVMSIDYETVKYFQGALDGNNPDKIVAGFGVVNNYDRVKSPISRPGSNATILGQGGLVDGVGGFIQDLDPASFNPLGAIQKAGATYNTIKNMNLKQALKTEVTTGITNALMNPLNNTGRNVLFNTLIYGSTPNQSQGQNGRVVVPPPINR